MAFILSQFPLVDETFILREMAALAEAGFDFDLYAFKKSPHTIVQKAAQKLMSRLIYRRYFWSWEVLADRCMVLHRRLVLHVSGLSRADVCAREVAGFL